MFLSSMFERAVVGEVSRRHHLELLTNPRVLVRGRSLIRLSIPLEALAAVLYRRFDLVPEKTRVAFQSASGGCRSSTSAPSG